MTHVLADLQVILDGLSPEEEEEILRSYRDHQLHHGWDFTSFEELVTSQDGFGLTNATPLQRAVCRVAEGRPLGDLKEHTDVLSALGVASSSLVPDIVRPPDDLFLIAGIRTAKSTFAAAWAVWASQTVDISKLSAGEVPRFPIMSLSKDNAGVVVGHLLGALRQPRLRHLRVPKDGAGQWAEILKESSSDAISSLFIWSPDGRPMEICVVAGKRAGASVISRWLFGLVLDEAPRMLGADEAVVNYEDSKKGARGRLLEGANVWSIGSPYQPYGPVYDKVQESWGNPTEELFIFKARGPQMNPVWWTPGRCEKLKRTDPSAYQTDVEAEFADVVETLFTLETLKRCTRKEPLFLPYNQHADYAASMDPATRSNAWTLVIVMRQGNIKRVAYHQQWQGSPQEPLRPVNVLKEVKERLRIYHLDATYTDQWSADALRDIAEGLGFTLVIREWSDRERTNLFLSLAEEMKQGWWDLPPDRQIEKDLKLTKKKPNARGPTIQLTKTTDGRHCDYSPAIARAGAEWISDVTIEGPAPGSPEALQRKLDAIEQEEVDALKHEANAEWWAKDPWELT